MKSSNRFVHFLLLFKNHFGCVEWIFGNFFQHLKTPINDRSSRIDQTEFSILTCCCIKLKNALTSDGTELSTTGTVMYSSTKPPCSVSLSDTKVIPTCRDFKSTHSSVNSVRFNDPSPESDVGISDVFQG